MPLILLVEGYGRPGGLFTPSPRLPMSGCGLFVAISDADLR